MVTRRRFLGALAGLTAVTALAGAGIRLPKRTHTIVTDPQDVQFAGFFSNTLSTPADLSEKALEDLLNQIRDLNTERVYGLRPTKLIVPPHMAERARRILDHEPTLGERLWWWLSNSEYRNA